MTATADVAPSGGEQVAVFSLCGGHPALDLVNTLDNRFRADGPIELIPNYTAVLAFMEQTGLLERTTVATLSTTNAEEVAEAVRGLRETAANVLYAVADESVPSPADLRKLEQHALEAHQHQELLWRPTDGNSKFVWGWQSSKTGASLPFWVLALQISTLLTSDTLSRLRTCQCETCRWLFLDTSKNHTRRWCNMRVCGNRMKARRYQARRM